MLAIIISFLFGAGQTFLLKKLMFNITAGNRKNAFLYFFIKFVLYGVGIAVVMFAAYEKITYCFLGFAAGMPLTAIGLFIYCSFIKKQ